MKKLTFLLLVLLMGLIFSAGCQEKQKSDPRRAKLEAHSSYLLRQQLAAKDKKVLSLEKQLKDCQEEAHKQKALADNCMTKKGNEFMEMVGPMLEELNRIQSENRDLKTKISELERTERDPNQLSVPVAPNMPGDANDM